MVPVKNFNLYFHYIIHLIYFIELKFNKTYIVNYFNNFKRLHHCETNKLLYRIFFQLNG